ncbi:uncharacterized protein BCR38DRAFT_341216 [Pseudomassariella vexata]|uniref:M protein repeat protein n=1 Tax=Pseudomassariella vexata TaxID=1141098 RepID=A0A1Y2E1Q5_9PEZI|nr:uncharacterized protein BCR38DRAFT_341216 [Pseudomassariella vexata]ORY65462.1 hypothetical protein BCR38DRAFT_341216 [Pseudomassariella vexata]
MKKKKAKKTGGTSKEKKEDAPAAEDKPEASASTPADEAVPAEQATSPTGTTATPSQQSKLRSASFRAGSISSPVSSPMSPNFNPEGETAADIYRKQVARIEDLEKENKRLAKEVKDSEKRWQKAEDELADLHEAERPEGNKAEGDSDSHIEKLQAELAALQRQNAQLQSAASRRGHVTSPSVSTSSPPAAELQAQLASKASTIETMELELSRLRAQAERQASAGGTDKEQIAALEEKLARAEQAASKSSRELGDLKRNLERTTEKAVREGSSRTSAETKVRTLEQENSAMVEEKAELQKKHDALEKKVAALGTLHKENDNRMQALRREKEVAEKENQELKSKIERLEAENVRLRKKDAAEGGGDDEGVDELENEERLRLEKKVRDLEAEVYDLRRGIWHQRRRELEPGMEGDADAATPVADFTNIDLGSGGLPSSNTARKESAKAGGGFGDFFNALTGGGGGAGDKDELLDDDDMEFDEEAFRKAHEEDARKRIERIKEIKRGLKNWEGWRLDLVDSRRGAAYGVGEVFDI